MELTVSLVMQSHLSDAMIEMDFNPEQANHRLRFVKYLINMGVSVLALGRKDLVDISEIRQHKIAGAVYLKIDMQNINYLSAFFKKKLKQGVFLTSIYI